MFDDATSPAGPAAPPDAIPAAPRAATLTGRLFAAFLALAALGVVLVSVPSGLFDLDRHSVPKEMVLHGTALLGLLWLLRGRSFRPGIVEAALAAFVTWSAASALLAENRWISVRAFGLSYSAYLVFLCARRVAAERAAGIALRGLGIAAIVGTGIGVAQAYGLRLEWLTSDRPPGGTFGNRNFLAHFAAISAPVLVLLLMRTRHLLGTAFWLAGLALLAGGVVLTRSRAGWLGFGAGLGTIAVAWVLTRPGVRTPTGRRLRTAGLAIASGIALAILLPNQLEWRSDSPYAETLTRIADYRSGSGRGRLVQYENSLRLVADAPVFGVGPGNWFVHYPRVTTRGDRAFDAGDPIPTNPWPSSDWIALLVERGAVAVLLALGAAAAAILVSLRRLRSQEADVALPSMVVPAILAATFVTGAFDAVLLLAPPALFVAAATGLLLPITRPVVERTFHGRRRLVLALALLATGGGVLMLDAAQLAAIRITQSSTSRAIVERALRVDPGNYRLRLLLAGRGACSRRLPHARVAARLLPYHPAPRATLRQCGGG